MFRRSFKPDKCKLALKLAIPRIKLMKNKREARFKQLKRELAQLLESGKDQTARIRVEHVVNEEKTMAAYDLLEIYCELIVARMPMIESQKNCPIDLKEAISSVIFASARCEEIPELKDVTKHLTAKYGKDFTSSALELRPDCGVGRLLVEKLSIKPPDGQTKLKILTAIAEEHNIKWDPESFGAKESKIYDDLINGPNALLEATKIPAGRPIAQASTSHYEQRPTSVQVPSLNVQSPKHIAKNDVPSSFNEHSSRSSSNPKNFDYSNTTANSSISSGTYPPRSTTRETEYQGMEFRNSFYGNESAFPSPRQHGNMEFKDAAAAAMAAAESAERASMDARAAAEHLGNISQQYSMESNMSAHDMRDEEPRKNTGSTSQYEHHARHPVNNSFHGRNSTNCEQTDSTEQHNRTGEAENGLSNIMRNDDKSTCGSSKSTAAAFNEKPLVTNQTPDAYSQRNTSVGRQMEHFGEVSMKRNSGNEMHMHFVNGLHGIKNPQNVDHHEVKDGEQSRYSSSHSRSNTFRDDCDVASNLNWQKSQNDLRNSDEKKQFVNELHDRTTSDFTDYQEGRIGKQSSSSSSSSSNTFADDLHVVSDLNCPKPGIFSVENSFLFKDKESLQRSTIETTYFYDNASAVFDDYGSHLEEEHKVHEYGMNFSSPFQKSPTHPCPCTHSWSTGKKVESPEVSISQSHIFSEKRSTPVFFESSTTSAGPSHVDDLPPTFDNYGPSSESEEEVDKFDRNNNSSIGSQKKNLVSHQAGNSIFDQPLSGGMEDTVLSTDSGLEESKELNLGKLTDGLRNKGYMHPPSARFKQSSPPLVEVSVSSGSYNREPKAGPSHVDDLPPAFDNYGPSSESEEEVDKFDRNNNSSIGSQKKNFSHQAGNSIFDQPLSGGMEDTELSMDSSLEESKELNLGKLTDGLRNKGYMHPPSGRFKQSSPPLVEDSVSSGSYNREPKGSDEVSRKLNMRASVTHFDSSDDEEERSKHISSSTRDQYNRMPSFEDRRSTFTAPVPGNSDSDEDLPKTSSMAHSRTVFSHKKNVSPSNSPRHSTLETTLCSETMEKNSSSRSLGADEATSKLVSETKTSSSDETLKMSEKEQPHTSVPEIVSLSSAESSEAQTSIGERSTHVHPKLPDYDTLTTFLNSLKQNRP
ncbi:hypothetical protein HRI_003447500 [Hibiscus trionum]|uniref:Regulator of Vps4 activity in the MVB pathway protein n=1 Tax=Hibiscus trionum TaxID=183268 RepID=A0A9W7IJF3_HIBTR|nr:hypothetical protein HRI_003447500 [Hibiscus trionum]